MTNLTDTQIAELPPAELKRYIERGIIKVMKSQPIPTRVEETPEFKKHKKLLGHPIHLSEACRKYELALSTLSRWVKLGIVKKIGAKKNKIILDEAYVAYAVEVLKERPDSKGRWLFDKTGMPYTPAAR